MYVCMYVCAIIFELDTNKTYAFVMTVRFACMYVWYVWYVCIYCMYMNAFEMYRCLYG